MVLLTRSGQLNLLYSLIDCYVWEDYILIFYIKEHLTHILHEHFFISTPKMGFNLTENSITEYSCMKRKCNFPSNYMSCSLFMHRSYLDYFSTFIFAVISFCPIWCIMQESKSIGAEVNWGVRFRDLKDVGIYMQYSS